MLKMLYFLKKAGKIAPALGALGRSVPKPLLPPVAECSASDPQTVTYTQLTCYF